MVVLILVLYFVFGTGSSLIPSLSGPGTTLTSSTPTPTPLKGAVNKSKIPVDTKTYEQYVAEYGSHRIQFDANCQMTPVNPVYKNGTSILLDNRSSKALTITLNGKTYSLQAFGYWVVNLSSTTLPQQLHIGCNASPNIGMILLQAEILGQ